MAFGKRFSIIQQERPANKYACAKCKGTGRISERGSVVTCKSCKGIGNVFPVQEPVRFHPFS